MKDKSLQVSTKMAVIMGIFLPLAETVRRSNQLLDISEFFSWFDDYILGGVLLAAAYMVYKNRNNAVAYLIAAWGIASGALLLSFLSQFSYYKTPSGDPGIFSTTFVLAAKSIIFIYILIGLKKAIDANLAR